MVQLSSLKNKRVSGPCSLCLLCVQTSIDDGTTRAFFQATISFPLPRTRAKPTCPLYAVSVPNTARPPAIHLQTATAGAG